MLAVLANTTPRQTCMPSVTQFACVTTHSRSRQGPTAALLDLSQVVISEVLAKIGDTNIAAAVVTAHCAIGSRGHCPEERQHCPILSPHVGSISLQTTSSFDVKVAIAEAGSHCGVALQSVKRC